MADRTGRFAIFEQLLADGVQYMFGNPGTSEQGFLDALSDYPQLTYILALQETIAVAMADGYARASQQPAIVQLHTGVGLGNAIGMAYQAYRGHSPLVMLAGEAGSAAMPWTPRWPRILWQWPGRSQSGQLASSIPRPSCGYCGGRSK
jgi:benzoylformate decarboxylase